MTDYGKYTQAENSQEESSQDDYGGSQYYTPPPNHDSTHLMKKEFDIKLKEASKGTKQQHKKKKMYKKRLKEMHLKKVAYKTELNELASTVNSYFNYKTNKRKAKVLKEQNKSRNTKIKDMGIPLNFLN